MGIDVGFCYLQVFSIPIGRCVDSVVVAVSVIVVVGFFYGVNEND